MLPNMKTQNILLVALVISIVGCVQHQTLANVSIRNETEVVDMYAATTTAQLKNKKATAVIAATKDAAKANLKDPSSAQFRNVRLVPWGGEKVVCGEINAKNSYGGYVGFKRFVGSPTGASIEPVSLRKTSSDEDLIRSLNQACGG